MKINTYENEISIQIDAYGNENLYQNLETNMEMKSHRSKSTHMDMKSQIKINAYKNKIS